MTRETFICAATTMARFDWAPGMGEVARDISGQAIQFQRVAGSHASPGRPGRLRQENREELPRMKLLVLGATGDTGLQIVRSALEKSHTVTAFVRSPERLLPYREQILIRKGNLLNPAELEQVLPGHDAVLSGFGPRSSSQADSMIWQRFASALIKAMKGVGVRRLVAISTAFLFKDSVVPPAYLVGRLFFPTIVSAAAEMEHTIVNSGLDWTIVRPPRLTNRAHSGKYRVAEGHLPRIGFHVSRAAVAEFMVQLSNDASSSGKIIGISQ